MSPHGLGLTTVTGICIKARFGFLIGIIFCNVIFGLVLQNLNHFIWKKHKICLWGRLPWLQYANTTLNHNNVSIYCALLSRVAESEVKYPTPDSDFPKFPTA